MYEATDPIRQGGGLPSQRTFAVSIYVDARGGRIRGWHIDRFLKLRFVSSNTQSSPTAVWTTLVP